jgi:hypothetical protein
MKLKEIEIRSAGEKLKRHHKNFAEWLDKDWRYIRWPEHGRFTIKMHQDMVDFIHGSLIGLLLGFIIGGVLLRII